LIFLPRLSNGKPLSMPFPLLDPRRPCSGAAIKFKDSGLKGEKGGIFKSHDSGDNPG
jgi:hypothetical protein